MTFGDPRIRRAAACTALIALAAGAALKANPAVLLVCGPYLVVRACLVLKEPHA